MFKPLRDRVVVKPQVRLLSDLIYVDNKEPFNEGTVVAIGALVTDVAAGGFFKSGNGGFLHWPTHNQKGRGFQSNQADEIFAFCAGVKCG